MNSKINEIDPGTWYSASEICRKEWFLWKMVRSLTLFLESDEGKRILNPVVITRGAVKRYKIRGEVLIEALKAMDEGKLSITHGQTK